MYDSISLFVGALLDGVIGPNLFVPGEPFFIAAGYQVHQGIWTGVVAVLLGGLLGDQCSYWIGRRVGKSAQRKLIIWQPKTRRPIARCRRLLFKKANYVLLFARLLGPVAWVVPFIAGTHQIQWRRFSFFSTIGLLLGASQFIFWGYLLSYGIDNSPWLQEVIIFVREHAYTIVAVVSSMVFLYVGYRLRWRKMAAKFCLVLLGSMLLTNYGHFFWLSDDFATQEDHRLLSHDLIVPAQIDFKVYPGKSSIFDAQAVNIVYVGTNPRGLMQHLGWIENQTFSRNDIEWQDYIQLLKNNTPPVSDLFWNNQPQQMAFQLPGDLIRRSHIRWWLAGTDQESNQPLWIGAISYDDGLQLTPYSGIVTVLHSIDPNVDSERDRFARQVLMAMSPNQVSYQPLLDPIEKDEEHDYFTDGHILVIKNVEV